LLAAGLSARTGLLEYSHVRGSGPRVSQFLLAPRPNRHRAPPRLLKPGQCHVNFAEGCNLYIAVTGQKSQCGRYDKFPTSSQTGASGYRWCSGGTRCSSHTAARDRSAALTLEHRYPLRRYANDGGSSATEPWLARSITDCRWRFPKGEVWNTGLGLNVQRTTMIVSPATSPKLLPLNR